MSHKIRVSVIYGGPSSEHDVSVNTGRSISGALNDYLDHKYDVQNIFIDRQGKWFRDNVPIEIHEVSNSSDIVINGLHGYFGEDGKIQQIFETHNIPYIGTSSFSSAVAMNKKLAKQSFLDHGIKTPNALYFSKEEIDNNIDSVYDTLFNTWLLPSIVKPVNGGSSIGVKIVRKYSDLKDVLNEISKMGDVIIEEYIPGVEATCGVIEGFRGQDIYALPTIEIRPHKELFDYEAKYQGRSNEIVPAGFAHEIKREIEELARHIHKNLNLRHYSRSDFIIHPKRGIYTLEVNTLPGMTSESLMPKALRAVGSDIHEMFDHLIMRTLTI